MQNPLTAGVGAPTRSATVAGRRPESKTVASASLEVAAIAANLDRAFPPDATATHAAPTERPWHAKSIVAIAADDIILHRFGVTLIALIAGSRRRSECRTPL